MEGGMVHFAIFSCPLFLWSFQAALGYFSSSSTTNCSKLSSVVICVPSEDQT